MVRTKKITPMNPETPSYKRTQLIILPPKYDNNIKPKEIFEAMNKGTKHKVKKKKK